MVKCLYICLLILTTIQFFASTGALAGTLVYGARAAGMAAAFTGVADDPSAVAHNPAGIIQLDGVNVYAGGTGIRISTEYQSPNDETAHSDETFPAMHAYFTTDLRSERFATGIGVYSPFGVGGRKWDSKGPTRYESVESYVGTLGIAPVAAFALSDELSLGGGPVVMYAESISESRVDQKLLGAPDASFRFEGDGVGFGFNAGLLYDPQGPLAFGLNYRSPTKVVLSGRAELENIAPVLRPLFGTEKFVTDAETELEFPQTVGLGVSWRATQRLLLALDLEWVNWSVWEDSKLDLDREIPAAGFTDPVTQLDWKDVLLARIGAEFSATEKLRLRAGYAFSEGMVPTSTLGPASPESDQHNISLGIGYSCSGWVIDAFYTAAFATEISSEKDSIAGDYETLAQYAGISIGFSF
jgi:long-chain fatty acid transport protein